MQLSNKSCALIAASGPPGQAGRDVGLDVNQPCDLRNSISGFVNEIPSCAH